MQSELVSVIIPTYNAGKYIKDAIISVLNQTYPYFEIIIIDDASCDNTAEVVRSIKDERIRYICHKENMGPGGARNTGIDAARGRWMAELDADDQWKPQRLEKLLAAIKTVDENYFIADNTLCCFDTPTGLKPWFSRFEQLNIILKNKILDIDLVTFVKIGAPAIYPIIPLKFIRKNKLRYSQHCYFGEDFEFYCQLLLHGLKLRLFEEPLYLRRLTPGSLSTKNNNDLICVYHRLLSNNLLNNKEKEILRESLNKIEMQQPFNDFCYALKKGSWHKAFWLLLVRPNLIIDCLRRIPRLISYCIAARRVHGKLRF